jgi:hypothetical protein
MKNDFPPMMKENTPEHTIHPDHIEKHYGGDGHKHHHHIYGEHAAGHKKHHEHVKAMCGGGMPKK